MMCYVAGGMVGRKSAINIDMVGVSAINVEGGFI